MLPYLAAADFDGALGGRPDRRSTPPRRPSTRPSSSAPARSTRSSAWSARRSSSSGLSGWAFLNWRRFGKDPVYLDDPSVLMPAPPPDLTAASGAMIMDGGTSRRALTTAMLDLASRGLIAFREDDGGLLGLGGKKVGIDVAPADRRRGRSRPSGRATRGGRPGRPRSSPCSKLRRRSAAGEDGGFITLGGPAQVRRRTSPPSTRRSRSTSSSRGWFGEKPSKVVARWTGRGHARHRRRRDRAHRRAQHPDLGADPDRRRRRSPAASWS